nr:MAG TPA: Protein-export protein SecB, Alkaline phosphatase chaperone, CHAPERONE-HYDROLASE complex [Caudoviricetes sp.]
MFSEGNMPSFYLKVLKAFACHGRACYNSHEQ